MPRELGGNTAVGRAASRQPLAFKAYEIEELADIYFFRPLGIVFAWAAQALHMAPTAVTVLAAAAGVTGGALVGHERLRFVGVALLVVHGVLDSSDGQLARMTGRTSELGRVLDGAAGYLTYAAIYVTILLTLVAGGAPWWAVGLVPLAAAANVVHAFMYDYHRTAYAEYAIEGVVADSRLTGDTSGGSSLLDLYRAIQRRLARAHKDVEAALGARALSGRVREDDRARYRRSFYGPVRGWNLFGDNTRFLAIGVLVWWHRLEWLPFFMLVPMNLAFGAMWVWQSRRDRRFLAGL
jgi:hypothetical protein